MANDSMDAKVLGALATAGSDLSLPHECRHYFYAHDRATAKLLAKRLRRTGYAAQELVTEVTDKVTGHLVLVAHHSIPTLAAIRRLRVEFEKIAAGFGAEYDGWEAAIVRSK